MGYSTDTRGRLCCDSCGQSGGVRKRKCKYKVTADNQRSANRHVLHYCYPPALCQACYRKEGGINGVHGESCRDGAASSQAEYDRKQELLDAGKHMVVAAYGSWQDSVPEGMVGVHFASAKYSDHRHVLMPHDDYNNRDIDRRFSTLEDHYPNATEWKDHP
ncbi:hypothetical protein SEA_LOZINAK_178 [Gordonia phage Lozinak]|uniref:Uncharacterized protein n=4 Tax=Smoothievirus TaxID=1982557 RepID=A0A2D1GGH4_9CAUD|nr:hypothetical protein BEN60_gp028 [Gordonia phage Smoothie]YP_009273213.1 hypothetical protein BH768_gp029 [Gordonia phage ClubL]YP_009281331.1 hypothetical protein BIZ74_gp028 [Gordonia phage Cucurbita]ATN90804.1 hypothetical protein SEA_LOZINAK_178 [Gordonia phage Lozinak]AUE23560.1 hypothetical protein SEA_TONIANN_178 [Gordonia phage Toniann]QAU07039.1 hypothetical protein SEA_APHELION_176 [Gordonia phage Aphelion]QYC53659.1 hypothetical protein SEA_NORVS_175 [Gordonia phage Norvs]WKW85